MKVLITGGTGLIGKKLAQALSKKQYEIFVLTRSANAKARDWGFPVEWVVGDLSKGQLADPRLQEIDVVFHLAGEPIASGRWNAERKKKIYDSRIVGTKNLRMSFGNNSPTLISASGVGYYGDCKDETLSEENAPGQDFLAKVCVDWEAAANNFPGRRVIFRTGMVLSAKGGALEKMQPVFRLGLGGNLGTGKQWVSWIHIDDLVAMYLWALENENLEGVFNGTAPHPVTNKEFTERLSEVFGKTPGPAVPAFALKVIFGELAGVLLGSQKASAAKALAQKFRFQHPELKGALSSLFQS